MGISHFSAAAGALAKTAAVAIADTPRVFNMVAFTEFSLVFAITFIIAAKAVSAKQTRP
jgi:hypothetical protein